MWSGITDKRVENLGGLLLWRKIIMCFTHPFYWVRKRRYNLKNRTFFFKLYPFFFTSLFFQGSIRVEKSNVATCFIICTGYHGIHMCIIIYLSIFTFFSFWLFSLHCTKRGKTRADFTVCFFFAVLELTVERALIVRM